MNFTGLVIGSITFVIIGVFHPLVIKAEYYLGTRSWILFLVSGLICIGLSLILDGQILTALLGVLGFTFLWSIKEVFEQEKRVKEGRYPKNPKRTY